MHQSPAGTNLSNEQPKLGRVTVLIQFLFQDETNSVTVSSWQGHDEAIWTW